MRFPLNKISLVFLLPCTFTSNAKNTEINTNNASLCPIPNYANIADKNGRAPNNNFIILSSTSSIKKGEYATFTGGVTLLNQDKSVVADELSINRTTSTVNADGDIHFQNKGIDIFADSLNINQLQKTTSLTATSYQLSDSPGHGSAEKININGNGKTLSFIDSSFTTCYGPVPDWQMRASEINISSDEKSLEAYNARFSLFNIPVLYVPYLTMPIGNDRQSGFLYPKISSSNNSGIEIETPYYINIAENMDATITPRYMSDRGTQLITEFRYLEGLQSGKIDIEYLNKDKKLINNDDSRYLARFQHVGTFSQRFRAHVDYTTISDDNYLVDLGSSQFNSNDSYLYQVGEIAYFAENWQSTLKLQDFEVLGNHQHSYKTLPQIEISRQQKLANFDGILDIYSELSSFDTADETQPTAQRYHVEAGLLYPIASPAWFLNSEVKVLQTNYHQNNISDGSLLEKNVSRTLPKIRFHGGVNFDRNLTLFNKGYNQTLEPQLQYLYIPEKDQNNIGIYDTTNLQDDYNGLFRDRRFSGIDRIAQANQISWGVTSRLLTEENNEVLRFSLGRIVYFNESNFNSSEQDTVVDKSALAADIFLHLSRNWQFSSDIQYNTDLSVTNKSQTSLDYLFSDNQTIQLNHRYARDVSGESLEQMSLATSVKIANRWQFVGRFTQDLKGKRSIESYAGLEYSSCCWGIRFTYHRNINSKIDDAGNINENRDAFDSSFNIQFVYNGINSNKSSNSVGDMFNSSIFGYKRPYFLNN
ncbi:LPS assembly protein LptD [Colwellia sp. M166]|uniref:LPS assembly protein LptD n=1 Tax=Colwellia sp. M166 TaxID=2583805 RepID=UPI00211E2372|nr:LPS assembly protein LptD [Colwellia sp. M166]UUO24438.1 LPS assembly protein LptD [Colwellia sp. M166]|tara:strand:- start:1 stop:2280 length:2280 start_codon:yes stop_codon:yes gene_type:complete